MLSYERQIRDVLAAAPVVYLDEKPLAETANDYAGWADQSDFAIVRFGVCSPQSNQITVPTFAELRNLSGQFHALIGEPDYDVDEFMRHEGAHVFAARVLRARRVAAGMSFWNVYDNRAGANHRIASQHFVQPFDFATIKLGQAAIVCHPNELSEGDILDTHAMGYDGVDEVGSKAVEFNEQWRFTRPMPVPLSYRPGPTIIL